MINRILIIALTVISLAILSLALVFYNQIINVKTKQSEANVQNVKTNQFLLSTINWSTERQKTILFMRDEIINEWVRIGAELNYDKAFVKSECIMRECERYPQVEPFAMLAVQRTESDFLDTLVSSREARGSWQFVQSTAMLLCQALGISYNDRIYSDPVVSTRLAGKYFDILYACYPDSCELARFADYNGGPQQAAYYRFSKSLLSLETRNFIDTVSLYRTKYRKEFVEYRPDKSIQIDITADTLGPIGNPAHKSKSKKHKVKVVPNPQ